MIRRAFRTLAGDRRGLGAVEFAMTAPFLVMLYLGVYQLTDAISVYRKVGTTARTMADLTTQATTVSKADVQNNMAASRAVLAPYAANKATTRVSQLWINPGGQVKVDWSVASDGNILKNKDVNGNDIVINIPDTIRVPNTYLIFSEITYSYSSNMTGGLVGPLTLSDHIYMGPRRSNNVPCDDC